MHMSSQQPYVGAWKWILLWSSLSPPKVSWHSPWKARSFHGNRTPSFQWLGDRYSEELGPKPYSNIRAGVLCTAVFHGVAKREKLNHHSHRPSWWWATPPSVAFSCERPLPGEPWDSGPGLLAACSCRFLLGRLRGFFPWRFFSKTSQCLGLQSCLQTCNGLILKPHFKFLICCLFLEAILITCSSSCVRIHSHSMLFICPVMTGPHLLAYNA